MAKKLSEGTKQKAQQMRQEGATVWEIAKALGISTGSASNLTRGIQPPSRKKAPARQPSELSDTEKVLAGPYREDTREVADKLERTRLEAAQLEAEARKEEARLKLEELSRHREHLERIRELEERERELRLELDKKGGGENAEVRELRRQLEELREKRREEQVARLENEISGLRRMIAQLSTNQTGKTELDVLSQLLSDTKDELKAWRNDIIGLYKGMPGPMGLEEKRQLTEGVVETVQSFEKVDRLAEELFYGAEKPREEVKVGGGGPRPQVFTETGKCWAGFDRSSLKLVDGRCNFTLGKSAKEIPGCRGCKYAPLPRSSFWEGLDKK